MLCYLEVDQSNGFKDNYVAYEKFTDRERQILVGKWTANGSDHSISVIN